MACALHQVVIETNTRNKKKMITTITGLELFGVKLSEASKVFGKKFACGCSVTKSATGSEQIDMQVGLVHRAVYQVGFRMHMHRHALHGHRHVHGMDLRHVHGLKCLLLQLITSSTADAKLALADELCTQVERAVFRSTHPDMGHTTIVCLRPAIVSALLRTQGDFLHQLAELVIKNYGKPNNIQKDDIYYMGGWTPCIGLLISCPACQVCALPK